MPTYTAVDSTYFSILALILLELAGPKRASSTFYLEDNLSEIIAKFKFNFLKLKIHCNSLKQASQMSPLQLIISWQIAFRQLQNLCVASLKFNMQATSLSTPEASLIVCRMQARAWLKVWWCCLRFSFTAGTG